MGNIHKDKLVLPNRKKYSIWFGIGAFYLLGGGFIFVFDDVVFVPLIQWIQNLSSNKLMWYLKLWARISVLIGAIIMFITIVKLRVKKYQMSRKVV